MCGIAGIYHSHGTVDPKVIGKMTEILRHRGPDDEGYLFVSTPTGASEERGGQDTVPQLKIRTKSIQDPLPSCNLAFGHRRLSIIDLTPFGHQPMSYDHGDYWIIYNGEIYNYIELKEELKQFGFYFQTNSDTEVILASYLKWGADCENHFNGDWAFCIYDKRQKKLFASRDRYGVKFFYYTWDGTVFAFASEIKALLSLPGLDQHLDPRQMVDFLTFGVIDHNEKTIYEDIHQLQPGQHLTLSLERNELKLSFYYRLHYNPELGKYDQDKSLEFAREIRDLLYDSVKIRLRSDVAVGSCLSGGLDSSSIVLFVNRLMKEGGLSTFNIGNHQKTFTASYRNDPIDETLYAQELIARTAIDGKFTFPDGIKLWDELDTVLYCQDEPFGSTSIYAQWNVMRLASQHVKVVLDGQGGDELFGGYFFYSPAAMAQGNIKLFFQRLSLYKKSALQELSFALGFRFIPQGLKEKVYRLFRRTHFRFLKIVFPQYSEYVSSAVKDIVTEVATPNLNLRLWQDFTKYTIPHLLHYEDRNSMAFGVEARVPFLDYRFVDYVMTIPAIYKIHQGWSKWIFRMAMQDVLPEKILWRKDKIGFSTPEKRWLLDGDNPFTSFMKRYQIPYDGNTFWWRLFTTSYWMKLRGLT